MHSLAVVLVMLWADVYMRAVAACVGASLVVRRAASLAFSEHHRSSTTPDIISKIGVAFYELFDSSASADGGAA